MDEEIEIRMESRIAPPPLTCPKCQELLPPGLGEIQCTMCDSKVRVEHEVIRSNFKQYGKDGKENKDQELFNRIMEEINTYTRSVSNLHPNQEHRPI